jgi:hypothetical protein
MNGDNAPTGNPSTERRQRQDLRGIFDDVCARVEPFCQTGGVALEYWASRAIREAYPSLDEQGLQIVVGAALRVCGERAASGGR